MYDGQWENGMKEGQGQLITKMEKYSGGWHKDQYHRFGVLVLHDGSVYEGDWSLGKKWGMGQEKLPNGGIYIGEFKNEKYHGKGQITYGGEYEGHQRAIYSGEFKEGKKTGQGLLILIDDDIQTDVEGEWVNDQVNSE